MGIRSDCWQTRSELGITPDQDRKFRRDIVKYNDNYGINGQESYILHGKEGYRLSTDTREIAMVLYTDYAKYMGCLRQTEKRIANMNDLIAKKRMGELLA